jgi:CBS domain-containing protein
MEQVTRADKRIGAVMKGPIVTIGRAASLREAAQALRTAEISMLAVMDGPELAGIVSERDIVRAVAEAADLDETLVSQIMTDEPRYVTEVDHVSTALEVMLSAGVRHLPVVEEGELVGVVSMRDLADELVDHEASAEAAARFAQRLDDRPRSIVRELSHLGG